MNANLTNLNFREPAAQRPERVKINVWLSGRRNYPQSPFIHARTHAHAILIISAYLIKAFSNVPFQTPQRTTAAVASDNCYADDGAFGTSHTVTHSNLKQTSTRRLIQNNRVAKEGKAVPLQA